MLAELSIKEFTAKLASTESGPGGGSAAALTGLVGASLMEMVINLTMDRDEFTGCTQLLIQKHTELVKLREELDQLIDRDAAAFKRLVDACQLPQEPETAERQRGKAIQQALGQAAEVPLAVARASLKVLRIARELVGKSSPHVASDLVVGALASHTGVVGALLNITINLPALEDEIRVNVFKDQVRLLRNTADEIIAEIQDQVYGGATFAIMRREAKN